MTWWTDGITQPKTKSRFFVEISDGFFLPAVKTVTKPTVEIDTKEVKLLNHYFNYPGLAKWQPIKITLVDMRGALNDLSLTFTTDADRRGESGPNENFGRSKSVKVSARFRENQFDTATLLAKMLQFCGYMIPTQTANRLGLNSVQKDNKTPYRPSLSTPEKASTIANAFGKGMRDKTDWTAAGVGLSSNNQSVKIIQVDPDGYIIEKWILHNPLIKTINWGDLAYDSDDPVEYSIDIVYDFATHSGVQFNGNNQPPKYKPDTTAIQQFMSAITSDLFETPSTESYPFTSEIDDLTELRDSEDQSGMLIEGTSTIADPDVYLRIDEEEVEE